MLLLDDYKETIKIYQGQTWKFQFIVYDDDFYKSLLTDFISNLQISEKVKEAILVLIQYDTPKEVLYQSVSLLLDNEGVDTDTKNAFATIFETQKQTLDLTDKEVTIYFKIDIKGKLVPYSVTGTNIDPASGLVEFVISTRTRYYGW